jgi:hypothetical protein
MIKEKQIPDLNISKIVGLQEQLSDRALLDPDGKVIQSQLPVSVTGKGIGVDGFYRNTIINGNFDVWQRDVTQTSNGYGSDDRWKNTNSGSTKVHSRVTFDVGQTEVPNNPTYFSRTEVSSVPGITNYVGKSQSIEDVTKLAGKTMTLSFWAKADSVKPMSIEFYQHFGTGGSTAVSGIGTKKVMLNTTWQKIITTVTFPTVEGKIIGANNLTYLIFWFDAGSNVDLRTDSLGNQSGIFDIAQVQLNEGDTDLPFLIRSYAEELLLCQRYYYKKSAETAYGLIGVGRFSTTTGAFAAVDFHTTMRVIPTVGYGGKLRWLYGNNVGLAASSNIALSSANTNSCGFGDFGLSGLTAGTTTLLTGYNDSTAYASFDAEL